MIHELDAKGLNCPMPILRTKKAISKLDIGDILKVITTDPGSVKDMESFCNQTGNKLIAVKSNAETFEFEIEKFN